MKQARPVLLLLLCLCFRLSGQPLVIDCDFTVFRYKLGHDLENGTNAQPSKYTVHCSVWTNRWRIEFPGEGPTEWWSYDGTNLIEGPFGSDSLPNVANRASMKSLDACPLEDSKVTIPWLAFCSGQYLRSPARLIPNPVVYLRATPDAFAYEDKTKVFPDRLGLPEQIELYASDVRFAASVTNSPFEGTRDVDLWRQGANGFKWDLKDGFLRFRYTVSETTNVLGVTVPLRFNWKLGIPETGKLIELATGRVTSVRVPDHVSTSNSTPHRSP